MHDRQVQRRQCMPYTHLPIRNQKESLNSSEVGDHIESGIRRVVASGLITKAPMIDSGKGFTEALVKVTWGPYGCLHSHEPKSGTCCIIFRISERHETQNSCH